MTPCTTGCKKYEGVRREACRGLCHRHPIVGSTLAVTNTSDEGFDLTYFQAVTKTWWRHWHSLDPYKYKHDFVCDKTFDQYTKLEGNM